MTAAAAPRRRVRISRLELDVRGVAPATAEAAARALGPALARALTSHRVVGASIDRIDAGRVASSATAGAQDLAAGIAGRLARVLHEEGK